MAIDPQKIYVIYGNRPKEMALEALGRLNLQDALGPGMTVGLKPNLVVAKPSHTGATTSAGLVQGVIEYLHGCSIRKILILESSGVGHCTRQAFEATGLLDIAKRYGVGLIDLKEEPTETIRAGDADIRMFKTLRQVDYLINLPVVKAHCQTRITCALKNLKGLIPDSEKRRFHSRGLHEPIARLNTLIRPELIVADGMEGDLSFEEGGSPVRMDRILIAKDPVLLDSYVASLLGYRKEAVRHLVLSETLGVGKSLENVDQIVEMNPPAAAPREFAKSSRIEPYLRKMDARQACSICVGSLIHALERYARGGRMDRIDQPLHIGQGFKKKTGDGIGIGRCAGGFRTSVDGCPPQAVEIVSFLETCFGKR